MAKVKKLDPGVLLTANLNREELDFFIKLFSISYPQAYLEYWLNVLDKKEDALMLMDVFHSTSIKFPNRACVLKLISNAQIYLFCKQGNFSDAIMSKASKKFKKRLTSIRMAIKVTNELLARREKNKIQSGEQPNGEDNKDNS